MSCYGWKMQNFILTNTCFYLFYFIKFIFSNKTATIPYDRYVSVCLTNEVDIMVIHENDYFCLILFKLRQSGVSGPRTSTCITNLRQLLPDKNLKTGNMGFLASNIHLFMFYHDHKFAGLQYYFQGNHKSNTRSPKYF